MIAEPAGRMEDNVMDGLEMACFGTAAISFIGLV